MIEANTLPNALTVSSPGRINSVDENNAAAAPGFSFALAAASLETNAAQSLQTHGAAPSGTGSFAAATTSDAKASAQGNQPLQTIKLSQDSAAHNNVPQQESAPTPSAPNQAATPASPSLTSLVTPGPQTAIAAVTIPTPGATAQLPATSQRTELPALRAGDTTRPDALKAPRPTGPAARPDAPTQDFARLLARRLDSGATQFELRLDPPDLGRVEANLKVSEKGENVLALKFEHQSTLDLFSRDDAALRSALSSSGFDLDHQQLSFSLAETIDADGIGTRDAASVSSLYEPKFIAAWSSGAIDLSL